RRSEGTRFGALAWSSPRGGPPLRLTAARRRTTPGQAVARAWSEVAPVAMASSTEASPSATSSSTAATDPLLGTAGQCRVTASMQETVRSPRARVPSYAGGGVSGYTRQEVAQRAGVRPDYVGRLARLRLPSPRPGPPSPL